MPLHVLVWNLTRRGSPRPAAVPRRRSTSSSRFLRERGLAHALAHPLYRMGPPLTVSHVERMMLLFGVWEGRNGARPQRVERARVPARRDGRRPRTSRRSPTVTGIEPAHARTIALTGGSDDHGALDIATTWTEAPGDDACRVPRRGRRAAAARRRRARLDEKLAHAVAALARQRLPRRAAASCRTRSARRSRRSSTSDAEDAAERHGEIADLASRLARLLGERARSGGVALAALPTPAAGSARSRSPAGLAAPYLATAHHHAGTREGARRDRARLLRRVAPRRARRARSSSPTPSPRRTASPGRCAGSRPRRRTGASPARSSSPPHEPARPGTRRRCRPTGRCRCRAYEALDLRFPLPTEVLARVEAERPDVDPRRDAGPGRRSAGSPPRSSLGLPLVGSYHTELGPYALHLTRDPLVAEAIDVYVDWFYRQCATRARADAAVAEALRGARASRTSASGAAASTPSGSRPSAATRRCARRLLGDGGACCSSRSGGCRRRSGSTCCSTRSRCLARERPACGSSSPATGRRGAARATRAGRDDLPRRAARRRARGALRERRRLLLPEHDRHVRPGAARGRRVRPARRRRRGRRRARARRRRAHRAARAARRPARARRARCSSCRRPGAAAHARALRAARPRSTARGRRSFARSRAVLRELSALEPEASLAAA